MIATDGNRFLLAHKKLRRRGICMNVLVVEDEALVSLLMQEIVEQAGHACIGPAASVTEARALVDSRHVDAALLDIWLKYDEFVWPGQSGPAFDVPVGTPSKNQEEKEKLKAKDIDADYSAAMKRSRVSTPKVVSDPWQNVRTPSPSSDKK
jgi:DNA-binding NarL/FixJ family response regulator